ncbi:hypothetical protein BDV96DRAFT_653326 [Lophiotrema nucula]|uniref:ATP synthase subunit K, mitochondrial n=1 Tax=Lophiotrema nucula TaxID=690887 RepID=A0A6A5YLH0_9PLEO|nr:hypothetical protein BDV96DRAFT_653326 [Lophiotrema nucula]
MATLGSTAAIAFFSLPSKPKDNGPPINAKSKEEESFVKDFVKKAQGEKK